MLFAASFWPPALCLCLFLSFPGTGFRPEIPLFPGMMALAGLLGSLCLFRVSCAACGKKCPSFLGRYTLILLLYLILVTCFAGTDFFLMLPVLLWSGIVSAAAGGLFIRHRRLFRKIWIWAALLWSFMGVYRILQGIFLWGKSRIPEGGAGMPAGAALWLTGDLTLFILMMIVFLGILSQKEESDRKNREDRLFSIIEKAADIVFYYSLRPQQEFSFISPSVEAITGYRPGDFYKNPKLHIELTHEEDRETIRNAFSGLPEKDTRNFIRWQRKDGEFIYLEYHNSVLYENGEPAAVEGILRDITGLKLAEKEMTDSKKARQLLLSYVSHELKTPLTYIMGYTELLARDETLPETEMRRLGCLVNSKAVFLRKLVDDLLLLSKMEAHQFTLEFTQIRVEELFQRLDLGYRGDVSAAGIEYKAVMDPALDPAAEVLADVKRIEQVYVNLLRNAIQYAGGSRLITLECGPDEKKGQVWFRVTDTGDGISPEDLNRIFEPFYRGKNRKESDGSGIGLSLSRQIVLAHGGEMDVWSRRGKGSRFSFSLPFYREGEAWGRA